MVSTKAQKTVRKTQKATYSTQNLLPSPTPATAPASSLDLSAEPAPLTLKASQTIRNYVLKAKVTTDSRKVLHALTKSLKLSEFDFHDFHTTHVAKALEASSRNVLVCSKADI